MKEKHVNVREMALVAVMAAVICILGPLSLPIGIVPISLTNLAVFLAVYVLGYKRGTLSCILYLLIGTVGVPVFSGFSGGVGKLFGPTGGYLIGFIFMALASGWIIDHYEQKKLPSIIGMVIGTAICYAFGTVWLAWQAGMSFGAALAAGVLPFLIGDALKIVFAAWVGPVLHRQLTRSGVLAENK